jgi:hypothetical protein
MPYKIRSQISHELQNHDSKHKNKEELTTLNCVLTQYTLRATDDLV